MKAGEGKQSAGYGWEEYLHLFILFAFAVVHPLLEVLSTGPEFFVVRGSGRYDVPAMLLLLFAGIPLLLSGMLCLCGMVSGKLRSAIRWTLTLVLVFLIFLPMPGRWGVAGYPALAAGLAAGVFVASILPRSSMARVFVTCLAPVLVISPLLFLANRGVYSFLFPETETTGMTEADTETPIVFILFDEFALHTLLDENMKIDGRRFPNFSAFAGESFWFRNTTAVNQFTPIAVPAVLSGRYPNPKRLLPTVQNYPANLFTMFQRSHDPVVYEPITKLCPPEVCLPGTPRPRLPGRLLSLFSDLSVVYLNYLLPRDLDFGVPDIEGKWNDFWNDERDDWKQADFRRPRRVAEIEAQIKKIRVTGKPLLFFTHAILPHMPYQFTPSGKTYDMKGPRHGYVRNAWDGDPVATMHGFQRYLMQLAKCDRLLGRIVKKLKEEGLYDKSVVVVAADHGVSFRSGTYRRGNPDREGFYEDILSVPFFIKRPFQREGVESDMNVQTIDILPSIADAAGVPISWRIDGKSVFDSGAERPQRKRIMLGSLPISGMEQGPPTTMGRPGDFVDFPVPAEFPRRSLDWKVSLPGYLPFRSEDPFFLGPHSEFVGSPVGGHIVERKSEIGVELFLATESDSGGRFLKINLRGFYLPVRIPGTLEFPTAPDMPVEVAAAVNGVLRSFTGTSENRDPRRKDFELLLSDSSFVAGRNSLELFLVKDDNEGRLKLEQLSF